MPRSRLSSKYETGLFRTTHPVFFDTYRALRVPKALAVRYRKENGQLEEGQPIPDTPTPAAVQPTAAALN
ncbi:MAG: hypothetical protein HY962_14890 [Ignavibacteriae bacterium]|nr:hypothetical protein [Ignavibacteriota bacterium]